ncbi:Histidine protein methyltransferase 1 [Tetrabaena socialis]|uniref:protein-histidine N-methyltransferase n=1 Tax=Tetrabaena socialis TaxID=47790 RepID=A0A2J8A2X1_9CHLO|nr:Histidine protein methyltransferase 1 [Tetrabaena socialis]|eukprot:PNH06864.1 Histidine protein methyltransferase 1 [Tetrabaena socialis]
MAEEGFKFNFGEVKEEEASKGEEGEEAPDYNEPAAELIPRAQPGVAFFTECVAVAEGLELVKGTISSDEAATLLSDQRVATSDLVPGKYEGGFKLWECSLDLCRLLLSRYGAAAERLTTAPELSCELQGKKVLELGCGHGLPGIVAAMCGADVHFQDYNVEVLRRLTAPNVIANMERLPRSRPRPACRYYSGDWRAVGELLTGAGYGGHYDLILSSETIYSLPAQERLLECIKQLLQPPHGVALIAAKRYYFGVGGGMKSFRALVQRDGIFETSVVAQVEEKGSGNVREVVVLKFPDSIHPYFL